MMADGSLQVHEIDGFSYFSQEFSTLVRTEVEERGAAMVMIDGVSGYRLTLEAGKGRLLERLHALGRYLKNMGTTTIFIDGTATITGCFDTGVR